MKRTLLFLGAGVSIAGVGLVAADAAASVQAPLASFSNCTAMHTVYPHGVGRYGARDHTSGTPVTNFKRSNWLYWQNSSLDRDKDGIACEKL